MRKLLGFVIGTVVGVATLRLVTRYVVEGRSMLRAYAPGDRLVVESLSYRLRRPRAGEVVVVQRDNGRRDLKRIAAKPGDRAVLPEGERELGEDEWFVLGDNLAESEDSRRLGPVARGDIKGRVWFKY